MASARNTSLKLLPAIAAGALQRARQFSLPLSHYFSILIWNQAQNPVRLQAEPDSPRHTRVHVPCTVRAVVWAEVRPVIAASKLSANAFVEALIARDLRSAGAELIILPARGTSKPRLG